LPNTTDTRDFEDTPKNVLVAHKYRIQEIIRRLDKRALTRLEITSPGFDAGFMLGASDSLGGTANHDRQRGNPWPPTHLSDHQTQ
jgi:hypothetical protein